MFFGFGKARVCLVQQVRLCSSALFDLRDLLVQCFYFCFQTVNFLPVCFYFSALLRFFRIRSAVFLFCADNFFVVDRDLAAQPFDAFFMFESVVFELGNEAVELP